MKISNNYNRFLHGVIYNQVKAIQEPLKVFDGKFIFRPCSISLDSVKQLLKHIDLDYPRNDKGVLSITQLTSKQVCEHIEFIILLLGENGHTFEFIEDEWNRILKEIKW
jgi:hypothetical protein